jgi:hypothetical protein
MNVKMSRSQWEQIGKKAGWSEKHDGATSLRRLILSKPSSMVLKAIKALGEESIAGFSGVEETDIFGIVDMCEPHELAEIYRLVEKQEKGLEAQPELFPKTVPFEEFRRNVWMLLQNRYGLYLSDVNPELVSSCHKGGETPEECVEQIREKYDLERIGSSASGQVKQAAKRRRCIRCGTTLQKHPDQDRHEGIYQCPNCFLNYSPKAQTGLSAVYDYETGEIRTGPTKKIFPGERPQHF